jgi:hypothetical protein
MIIPAHYALQLMESLTIVAGWKVRLTDQGRDRRVRKAPQN